MDALLLRSFYEVEEGGYNAWLKRGFDIVIAAILILSLLSWLYPILYILIRLTSKGPGLFVQKRIGYNEQVFDCYKFRTMYVNEDADRREALENDNRITPLGAWLRKTCLDELPQLINVLKGDMSIVGPRPHMLYHHVKFTALMQHYNDRHAVKPGITGLAQIMGYHGSVINEQRIHNRTRLDLFYVRKATLWLDIKIVFCTMWVVASRKSVDV